jgi:predicted NUDIX family NTP pyrophosphohydrolase
MKKSAGVLLYKNEGGELFFFLAHPGGPFWKNKDAGSWSIPKGEFDNEQPLDAAIREFEEEIGLKLQGKFIALAPVKLKSGKTIYAWALEMDIDALNISSNTFEMEWPPKSGKTQRFPEIDRAGWFNADIALEKINVAQQAFICEVVLMFSQQTSTNYTSNY